LPGTNTSLVLKYGHWPISEIDQAEKICFRDKNFSLFFQKLQVFVPGTIRRHFYLVPDKCTYAVVKINSNEKINQVQTYEETFVTLMAE
jgi:hypothetical protein